MSQPNLLVFTTMPDKASAEQLAKNLVKSQQAACVNILPEMTSIYRWQGESNQDTEHSLIIKTTQNQYDALQTAIHNQHPYELPEIIAVPITKGLPAYLDWIKACTEN